MCIVRGDYTLDAVAVAGFCFMTALLVVWGVAAWRMPRGGFWFVLFPLVSVATAQLGAAYLLFYVPYVFMKGMCATQVDAWLVISAWHTVTTVACCLFIAALASLFRRWNGWPWQGSFFATTVLVVVSCLWMTEALRLRGHYPWQPAWDHYGWLIGVTLALVVAFVATITIFVRAGCRLPDVRARWELRLDRALEGLAYNGWSHLPYASPYLPRFPPHWLDAAAKKPGETDDAQKDAE